MTRPLKVKNVKTAAPSDMDNVSKHGTPMDGQDNDADIVAVLQELLDVMKQSRSNHAMSRSPRRDKSMVECFKCHKMGHYANECTPTVKDTRQRRDSPNNQ